MTMFKVTFESSGFTQDRSVLGAQLSETAAKTFDVSAAAPAGSAGRVVSVIGGYITEDDEQYGSDLRVFASVTLLVESSSEKAAESMEPPEALLDRVAYMLGTNSTGMNALALEEHAWEVVEAEVA